jgi:hypothetical protein
MGCVAELNDESFATIEEVPETYEKPYDPQEPVTLHADVRARSIGIRVGASRVLARSGGNRNRLLLAAVPQAEGNPWHPTSETWNR